MMTRAEDPQGQHLADKASKAWPDTVRGPVASDSEIEHAIGRGDIENLRLTAHAVKGSVGNFAPKGRAYRAALALEKAAGQDGAAGADALAAALREEMDLLAGTLHAFAAGPLSRPQSTPQTAAKPSSLEDPHE